MTPEETVDEFIRRVVTVSRRRVRAGHDDLEYDNVPMGKNRTGRAQDAS